MSKHHSVINKTKTGKEHKNHRATKEINRAEIAEEEEEENEEGGGHLTHGAKE